MRSTMLLTTLAMLGLLLVGCKNENRPGEVGQPIDLAYVTDDFAGAIIAHPAKMMQSETFASFTSEEQLKKAEEKLGIDPRTIEQVTLLVGPPQQGPEPAVAGVISLSQPIDHESIIKKLELDVEKLAHNGKDYFKATEKDLGEPTYFFYPNDYTVVVSTEPTLKKILSAKGEKLSPLAEQIKKTDLEHDVVVVGVTEPVLGLYRQAIAGSQPKGVNADFAELPEKIKAATLTFDVSTKQPVRLILEGHDAEAAKEIATRVKAAHGIALAGLAEQRDDIEQQVPFGKGAAVSQALTQALESIDVQTNGNIVTVEMEVSEPVGELAKEFQPILEQMTGQNQGG